MFPVDLTNNNSLLSDVDEEEEIDEDFEAHKPSPCIHIHGSRIIFKIPPSPDITTAKNVTPKLLLPGRRESYKLYLLIRLPEVILQKL
jgi:hypothetical protein